MINGSEGREGDGVATRSRRVLNGLVADAWRATVKGGVLLAVGAVVCAMGCGDGGLERASVAGRVVLDGEPLESGSIAFYPAEGTRGPSSGGAIKAGRYRIDSAKGVVIGKSRVEITALRKTGRMIPHPIIANAQIEEYVEAVPSRYNVESTLIREIASGENQIDFDLKSK